MTLITQINVHYTIPMGYNQKTEVSVFATFDEETEDLKEAIDNLTNRLAEALGSGVHETERDYKELRVKLARLKADTESAEKTYEQIQEFFKTQGIKDMATFPFTVQPQLPASKDDDEYEM